MKEKKPEKSDEEFFEEINSDKIQAAMSLTRKHLKAHRLLRAITNTIIKYMFFTQILFNPKGGEIFKDLDRMRFFFNREERTGLLEDAILNPDIYHPNKETTSLELSSASAGRWSAYDFNRGEEFKLGNQTYEFSKTEGRLIIFKLDEIQGNNANTYTPTTLFNLFNVLHILTATFPTIDEALTEGFLRETNYKEAYSKVGLYSKYKLCMYGTGIVDHPLYTVTPKGNSVVFLEPDEGDQVKKPKASFELKPGWNPSS